MLNTWISSKMSWVQTVKSDGGRDCFPFPFFFFWGGGPWAPPVEPYKKIKRSNGVKRKLGQFLLAADPVMVI